MRKKHCIASGYFIVFFIFISAISYCGTYAVPGSAKDSAVQSQVLSWIDSETSAVIFTVNDIVRFDWDKQIFEVTHECAMDIIAYTRWGLCQRFVVLDKEGLIYKGQFVNPISSFSHSGPTIKSDFLGLPVYEIEGGYPAGDSKEMYSECVRASLEAAGVLSPINEQEEIAPIEQISSDWVGEQYGFKVRTVLFPETFRLGEQVRMHVDFARPVEGAVTVDKLQVIIHITSNGEKNISKHIYEQSPPVALEDGICVCTFNPWRQSSELPRAKVRPGPAEVHTTILLMHKENDGWVVVKEFVIPPQEATILPPNQ